MASGGVEDYVNVGGGNMPKVKEAMNRRVKEDSAEVISEYEECVVYSKQTIKKMNERIEDWLKKK